MRIWFKCPFCCKRIYFWQREHEYTLRPISAPELPAEFAEYQRQMQREIDQCLATPPLVTEENGSRTATGIRIVRGGLIL